jgi:hypothetical protein
MTAPTVVAMATPAVLPTLFKTFRPDYPKNPAPHGNLVSGRNNKPKTNKLQKNMRIKLG